MNSGCVYLARKITSSKIWLKNPLYLKVWLWLLIQANHSDNTKNGIIYKRGEVCTTYHEIIQGVAYYHNKRHIVPTLKQIRIILKWFADEGMILIEPRFNVPLGQTTRADTRAYLCIKITIVNYDSYQDLKNYKGRHWGRGQGHNNIYIYKEYINKNKESLSQLLLEYTAEEQTLLEELFKGLSQTRKTGKLSDSIKVNLLQQLKKSPKPQVIAGIKTYLSKQYYLQGKNEKYLLGIIRNTPAEPEKPKFKSTGSRLLDEYYLKHGGF